MIETCSTNPIPLLRLNTFTKNIWVHMPFVRMVFLLIGPGLMSAAGLYFAERNILGTSVTGFAEALHWGVAAFSTVGFALTLAIGGTWISSSGRWIWRRPIPIRRIVVKI
jgi:voltage-gated potassium channel